MDINKCCKFCLAETQSVFQIGQFPEAPRAVSKPRNETIDFDIGICMKFGLIQQISKPRIKVLYEEFKNDNEIINQVKTLNKKINIFSKRDLI
tara:strand:+ start:1182 stop:1460 length:279 start_codon:yes stop_codon:yes gene_type:complete